MKRIIKLVFAFIFLGLTVALVYAIKNVDVAVIGEAEKEMGLSTLNMQIFEKYQPNNTWYIITEALGLLAIGYAAVFPVIALVQWIKRKSLFKVDKEIIALGFLYVIVLGLYVVFEKVIISYRPVILDETVGPEASFPSSHTMLAIVVFISGAMVLNRMFKDAAARFVITVASIALTAILVVGRLLSGVHWFTDILGGVLISATLLMLYSAVIDRKKDKKSA